MVPKHFHFAIKPLMADHEMCTKEEFHKLTWLILSRMFVKADSIDRCLTVAMGLDFRDFSPCSVAPACYW